MTGSSVEVMMQKDGRQASGEQPASDAGPARARHLPGNCIDIASRPETEERASRGRRSVLNAAMDPDRPPVGSSLARRKASVQIRIDELRRQLEQKRARRAERMAFFEQMTKTRQDLVPDPPTDPPLTNRTLPE